jgi:predicted nucleic acid-binding protein
MAKKAKAYVLDTWAVIAYLEDEPSALQIGDLIATAHEEQIPIYMSVVNVGEVWYTIQFQDADWALTQEAARFKSQHKMSYADCFVAALAKSFKADLVTGDGEFKAVEDQVKIQWV